MVMFIRNNLGFSLEYDHSVALIILHNIYLVGILARLGNDHLYQPSLHFKEYRLL